MDLVKNYITLMMLNFSVPTVFLEMTLSLSYAIEAALDCHVKILLTDSI